MGVKARGVAAAIMVTLNMLAAEQGTLAAAELQPRTVAAFERYQRLTEARLDTGPAFLRIDTLADPERAQALRDLREQRLVIDRLTTLDGGSGIDVPDGLVHHWMGTAFVRGATVADGLRLLQDYDAHDEIYAPAVERSRLIEREGQLFRVFLRFRMTKVITVVVNSEHEARFSRPGGDRAEGRIRSVRIAQVEDAGTPGERELPVGNDGGYLWRLNTYWRLLERDGGLYVQCESISLTRGIPFGVAWLIGPFVTSIPRESLTFTLQTTRGVLQSKASSSP
jgi:hypothetical protein